MKVCIGTVIYDKAFEFYNDYVESINSQDYMDFDVLLINDNLDNDKVNTYKKEINNNVIVENKLKELSISELRIFLLKKAMDFGYDLIVFADADDKFSCNRVSSIIGLFNEKYTFYYNDIYDFENNLLLNNLPKVTKSIDDILEYNYLGLSNTAIKLNNISKEYIKKLKNIRTNIFDWYLFSKILSDNHKGLYIKDSKTFYRLGLNNIAGIQKISEESIKKELDIKLEHYFSLKEENKKFNKLYNTYLELKNANQIVNSDYFTNNYNNYWWGFIRIEKKIFNNEVNNYV